MTNIANSGNLLNMKTYYFWKAAINRKLLKMEGRLKRVIWFKISINNKPVINSCRFAEGGVTFDPYVFSYVFICGLRYRYSDLIS